MSSRQFVKPKSFTHAEYTRRRMWRKPWVLGPDAETSKRTDIFYQLGIDPLDECTNSTLMASFVTTMGKIKPRAQTGLTWKNQRRIGKAIRRAKMMGIIPVHSRRILSGSDKDAN